MSLLGEIKRRKVFQVAAVYAVVAWLLIQIADVILPAFEAPTRILQVVIFLLILGFPVTLILSWAFDLTPEGVVRDEGGSVSTRSGGRRIEYALIGLLVVAVGWVLYRVEITPPEPAVEVVAEEAEREVLPNSIAVLPFENLNLDPEDAFFAAGIHDTILKELANIRDMNVISRTAMLRYADRSIPIPQVAEELNVQTVMEGSVQYDDEQVRVTVQLIDPQTNTHLWSEIYDRPFADIFVIQTDIAIQIAMALEARLSPSERESIERPMTNSTEALGLYFRAIEGIGNVAESNTADQVTTFHRYLDRAIELDPNFARAYAFKADRYAEDLEEGFQFPDDAAREERAQLAEQYAERALAIDPDLGLAHGALAVMYEYTRRTEEADAAYLRALELSPKDRDILINYAFFNYRMGRFDRSIQLAETLSSVDPLWALITLAFAHSYARNHDEAEAALRAWAALENWEGQLDQALALIELARGNETAAMEHTLLYEVSLQSVSARPYDILTLGYLNGRLGRPDAAQRYISQFWALVGDRPISAAVWVQAYLAIGDEERVLEQLEILAENRDADWSNEVWDVKYNRWVDPVLDRPAFQEVRNRIGVR